MKKENEIGCVDMIGMLLVVATLVLGIKLLASQVGDLQRRVGQLEVEVQQLKR